MAEQWKAVSGYEGLYEVSSIGRVRSQTRDARNTASSVRCIQGQIISPFIRATGYHTVRLAKAGRKSSCYVHRLVAAAFCSRMNSGDEVLHADGNKGNNDCKNLSWGTRSDNMIDRTRLGESAIGERHGMAKLTDIQVMAIRVETGRHQDIAARYGVSRRLVGMIKSGNVWSHLEG